MVTVDDHAIDGDIEWMLFVSTSHQHRLSGYAADITKHNAFVDRDTISLVPGSVNRSIVIQL